VFRNKIAHGEITHLVSDLSDYDLSAEQMAADQETKMRRFVSEWFNAAPTSKRDTFARIDGLMRFNFSSVLVSLESYEIQVPARPKMCHALVSFDR
jgi:hypothetical protein